MARRHRSKSKPDASEVDAALAAMDADELREVARDILLELDDRAHGRVVNRLIERAARNISGWTPTSPSGDAVSEIVAFAEAANQRPLGAHMKKPDFLKAGHQAVVPLRRRVEH